MRRLKPLLAVLLLLVFCNLHAASKDYALHQAVLDNDLQLVKRLLSKGAAIDVIGSRKYGYGSPLHLAVREGHLEIATLLLKRGAEVDVLDPDDFTPLHNAAWNGNLEMTELLLGAGADIEASTYDGDTPLKLAQKNDQAEVAGFIQAKLLASTGVDTEVVSTTTGVRDVSGTYVMTNLTDWVMGVFVTKSESKDGHEITIAQNGDQVTGTYDEGRGELWGEIKGDTIRFDWARNAYTGRGEWTLNPGSNESNVSLNASSGSGVGLITETKFNLTKIETEVEPIDVSGTYLIETTGSGSGMNYDLIRDIEGLNGNLITLNQVGNTITGIPDAQSHWIIDGARQINGTREGNTIEFYIVRGNEIVGSWEINTDATKLEGKWFTNGAGGASGKWNLTKIETDTASVPDVSGTYSITEFAYTSRVPSHHRPFLLGDGSDLEITIKQSGNAITGVILSGANTGEFEGVVRGREITIDLYMLTQQSTPVVGKGTWLVNGDALTGSYQLDDSSFGSTIGNWMHGDVTGTWNFRKIESNAAN